MSLNVAPNCENSSPPRTGRRWSKRPEATARMPSANVRSVWVSERTTSAAPAPMQHEQQAHQQRDAEADRARVRVELALRVERDRLRVATLLTAAR